MAVLLECSSRSLTTRERDRLVALLDPVRQRADQRVVVVVEPTPARLADAVARVPGTRRMRRRNAVVGLHAAVLVPPPMPRRDRDPETTPRRRDPGPPRASAQTVLYCEKSFSGKTRSSSTCPESNGSPNTLEPLTYSWPGHGGSPRRTGVSRNLDARSANAESFPMPPCCRPCRRSAVFTSAVRFSS